MIETKFVCDKCNASVVTIAHRMPEQWEQLNLTSDDFNERMLLCKECLGPILNWRQRRRDRLDRAKGVTTKEGMYSREELVEVQNIKRDPSKIRAIFLHFLEKIK